MGAACSAYRDRRGVYRILVGKTKGRPRPSWEDDIKTDFQKVGCGGMDRIELAWERDR
jgi:hypothetical protein